MEQTRVEQNRSGAGWGRLAPSLAMVLTAGVALGWLGAMGCAAPKVKAGLDTELMTQACETIQREYVDQPAASPTNLTYGAIAGMVDALGDTGHSTFLTPAMVRELKEVERGEFKGIGVEIRMKDDRVVIVAPIDGTPAQRAGLRAGEVITHISGQDISGWSLGKVIERISGPAGTQVRLTVEDPRTELSRTVTITRASIRVRDVTWRRLPGTRTAHVRIASFDTGAASGLRRALREIQRHPTDGIILDLRNNPGGILDEAVSVASQFLDSGNVLLAKDSKGHVTPVPVEPGGLAPRVPLVVVVNAGTASAAEIVAGALADAHRATLVGETTFGTGTVLRQFDLPDGSALLLAIEEWLTPNGSSFWHKGLKPEVAVALPTQAEPLLPATEADLSADQLQASADRQLLRALQLVHRPSVAAPAAATKVPAKSRPQG